jgi:DNA-binding HxlR family transcriptional regulator
MSPSKLDKYLNILEAIVERPQKMDYIARRVHAKPDTLKRNLAFLVSNGVVEKRRFTDRLILYAMTERGLSVFKTLRALKYMEKLRDSLPVVEEAREVTALLSKHSRPWKEE